MLLDPLYYSFGDKEQKCWGGASKCWGGGVQNMLGGCMNEVGGGGGGAHPQKIRQCNLPQGDNKEFLELAKIILSGSIDRNNGNLYHIQRPGADHNARWMSKSIYILKMELLGPQLKEVHWQTKKKLQRCPSLFSFITLKNGSRHRSKTPNLTP